MEQEIDKKDDGPAGEVRHLSFEVETSAYDRLAQIAKAEDRSIRAQARRMLTQAIAEHRGVA